MNKKRLYVILAVLISSVTETYKEVAIDLNSVDGDTLEEVAVDKVGILIATIEALFWEYVFCAAPNINNVRVDVEIKNIAYIGHYQANILPMNTTYDKWTIELSKAETEAISRIKDDLVALMVDMANGCISSENKNYIVRRK